MRSSLVTCAPSAPIGADGGPEPTPPDPVDAALEQLGVLPDAVPGGDPALSLEMAGEPRTTKIAKILQKFDRVRPQHPETTVGGLAGKSKTKKNKAGPQPPTTDEDGSPLPKAPPEPPGVGCTIPPDWKKKTEDFGRGFAFVMEDYCKDAVKLYLNVTGIKKLKAARTPFCPEGSLVHADDDVRGELAGDCCKCVMKSLWLARLSRPHLR